MKLTNILLATAAASVIALSGSVQADEKKAVRKAATAKVEKQTVKAAPFKNHWDAKSWDAQGPSFWNEKEAPAKAETKTAKK